MYLWRRKPRLRYVPRPLPTAALVRSDAHAGRKYLNTSKSRDTWINKQDLTTNEAQTIRFIKVTLTLLKAFSTALQCVLSVVPSKRERITNFLQSTDDKHSVALSVKDRFSKVNKNSR